MAARIYSFYIQLFKEAEEMSMIRAAVWEVQFASGCSSLSSFGLQKPFSPTVSEHSALAPRPRSPGRYGQFSICIVQQIPRPQKHPRPVLFHSTVPSDLSPV